jgi:hypothetical protein
MTRLDTLIRKLETNLGQSYATSEFDILRAKLTGGEAPASETKAQPEQPKEEQKAEGDN